MAVRVWWSTLTAAEHGLLDLLDEVERTRVAALDRPADRGRSLLAAALLRVAVADQLGVGPTEVLVDRRCDDCGGPHGAPRILGPGTARPWVSVAHSGLLVAVAVSPDVPVGVDVQREADLEDPAQVREWVCREAVFKAVGRAAQQDGGAGSDPRVTCQALHAPLPGYAAAIALPTGTEPALVVRHWPESGSDSESAEGPL